MKIMCRRGRRTIVPSPRRVEGILSRMRRGWSRGPSREPKGERTWVRYYGSIRTVSQTRRQPYSATVGDGRGAIRREGEIYSCVGLIVRGKVGLRIRWWWKGMEEVREVGTVPHECQSQRPVHGLHPPQLFLCPLHFCSKLLFRLRCGSLCMTQDASVRSKCQPEAQVWSETKHTQHTPATLGFSALVPPPNQWEVMHV